ncbi:carboxyphosphonoenolpyruvate phosphonomutase, putative [Talaromyces islandicus]|uniref:Carboxyphosphonoenolpyruvate phosphonomutase, putative n=1 Tax=Talaromyces islandicus TaxID=28573 RepID=A0A0U1M6J4_TALIS|nr:carboxyphosphonoenolpyruvate phosphonomutase, putative [Talaromyces islandicus]
MLNETNELIVCPGVYDGAGTTASRLGMAGLGLAQVHDMKTNAEMIANGPPPIADMDTDGKNVVSKEEYLQQHGNEECIDRLKAARDLGADVGLLELFTSKEQARQAVQDLAPWPLLLHMVENGAGPIITSHKAKDMGFHIMIFSFSSLAPAYMSMKFALETLKVKGVVGAPEGLAHRKLFEACNTLVYNSLCFSNFA